MTTVATGGKGYGLQVGRGELGGDRVGFARVRVLVLLGMRFWAEV